MYACGHYSKAVVDLTRFDGSDNGQNDNHKREYQHKIAEIRIGDKPASVFSDGLIVERICRLEIHLSHPEKMSLPAFVFLVALVVYAVGSEENFKIVGHVFVAVKEHHIGRVGGVVAVIGKVQQRHFTSGFFPVGNILKRFAVAFGPVYSRIAQIDITQCLIVRSIQTEHFFGILTESKTA